MSDHAPSVGPETEKFLAAQPNLVLGTIRRDGSPQASPLWYLWDGGRFLVSTIRRTAKWANLVRDPRCSVCVDEPETGRMVVAYGSADLIEGEGVRAITRDLVAKYYPGNPGSTDGHMERIFGGDAPERVLIAVRPDRIIPRRLDE